MIREYTAHYRYRDTGGLQDRFKRFTSNSLKEAKAAAKSLEGQEDTKWLIAVYIEEKENQP